MTPPKPTPRPRLSLLNKNKNQPFSPVSLEALEYTDHHPPALLEYVSLSKNSQAESEMSNYISDPECTTSPVCVANQLRPEMVPKIYPLASEENDQKTVQFEHRPVKGFNDPIFIYIGVNPVETLTKHVTVKVSSSRQLTHNRLLSK